jgi:HPt (histidine-containing phosphotransfer) domain-containing protein
VWSLPEELVELGRFAGPEAIENILAAFRTDLAVRIADLLDAVRDGDWAKVRAEAHAVKGGAVQVGAVTLGHLCEELETLAGPLAQAQIHTMLDKLKREIADVTAGISALNLQELFRQ